MKRLKQETENLDPLQEDEVVSVFLLMPAESLALTHIAPTGTARGTTYYCEPVGVRRNYITNPGFEIDLTGWTEVIDGGGAGSSARDTTQYKYGFASLKIILTASPNGGRVLRRAVLTAAAGEVWSFSVQAYISALADGRGRFTIDWRDAGGGSLGTYTVDIEIPDTAFVERKIENQTAPAGTVTVRIELIMQATALNGTGTGNFDAVLAEKATSVGTYFDGAINSGFWQGAHDLSISVKDPNQNAIIAGFFKAS